MAVYDGVDPAHFAEALQSLEDQTLSPEDFVLVEDGPLTAAHLSVIESFERGTLPLRRIALASRSGSGPAKQRGLQEVATDLVAIADADDICLPNRLELQASLMRDRSIDLLGSAAEEFDPDTGEILGVRRFAETHEEIAREMRLLNPVNHPTVMLRRVAVLDAGGYHDLPYLEDYDLWARLLSRGAKLANEGDVLVRFRGGAAAQRRRRSLVAFKSEWALQRRLKRYGLIPWWRVPINWVIRSGYRVLPGTARQSAYSAVFLGRGRRPPQPPVG
jgi:hypothetical protein